MHPGVKIEKQNSFGGFTEPSGLVLDGDHLIVADAGNNRLRVLDEDGSPNKSPPAAARWNSGQPLQKGWKEPVAYVVSEPHRVLEHNHASG